MQYAIRVTETSVHVDLSGELTFNDSRTFRLLLSQMKPSNDQQEVALNIKDLSNIDSSGLEMLLHAHDNAKRHRTRLVFIHPQGQVLKKLSAAATCNQLNIVA